MSLRRQPSVTKLKRPPIHESGSSSDDELPLANVKRTKSGGNKSAPVKKAPVVREVKIQVEKNEEMVPKKKSRVTEVKKNSLKNNAESKTARASKAKPKVEPAPKSAPRKKSTAKSAKFLLNIDDFSPKKPANLILTCGSGDAGQLGLGDDVTSCKRPRKIENFYPIAEEFLQIAAGGMHTVVLTADHEVYTCGCNDEGALGRDCYDDNGELRVDDQDCSLRLVKIDEKWTEKHGHAVQISAGDSHTAVLTKKGSVLIWGTFRDKGGLLGVSLNDSRHGVIAKNVRPTVLSSFEDRMIVKIASGYHHLAMLSSDQIIYTVGAGDSGQLGRVPPQKRDSSASHRAKTTALTPKEVVVVRLRKQKVQFVNLWCTGYCCFAKSSDGTIYVWGLNNYFQLGVIPSDPDQSDVLQPVPSECFTADRKWKQFVGDHHILSVTEDGTVYVIGRGVDSRLGLGNNVETLQVATHLTSVQNVAGVAASNSGSFVWTEDGVAYAWGFNNEGELGLGLDESEAAATPTVIQAKSLENTKVLQISANGQHSIIMAKK